MNDETDEAGSAPHDDPAAVMERAALVMLALLLTRFEQEQPEQCSNLLRALLAGGRAGVTVQAWATPPGSDERQVVMTYEQPAPFTRPAMH